MEHPNYPGIVYPGYFVEKVVTKEDVIWIAQYGREQERLEIVKKLIEWGYEGAAAKLIYPPRNTNER